MTFDRRVNDTPNLHAAVQICCHPHVGLEYEVAEPVRRTGEVVGRLDDSASDDRTIFKLRALPLHACQPSSVLPSKSERHAASGCRTARSRARGGPVGVATGIRAAAVANVDNRCIDNSREGSGATGRHARRYQDAECAPQMCVHRAHRAIPSGTAVGLCHRQAGWRAVDGGLNIRLSFVMTPR